MTDSMTDSMTAILTAAENRLATMPGASRLAGRRGRPRMTLRPLTERDVRIAAHPRTGLVQVQAGRLATLDARW